jgi:hypothetical protein
VATGCAKQRENETAGRGERPRKRVRGGSGKADRASGLEGSKPRGERQVPIGIHRGCEPGHAVKGKQGKLERSLRLRGRTGRRGGARYPVHQAQDTRGSSVLRAKSEPHLGIDERGKTEAKSRRADGEVLATRSTSEGGEPRSKGPAGGKGKPGIAARRRETWGRA